MTPTGTLPNSSATGETPDSGARPVPFKTTDIGGLLVFVTMSVPARAPVARGLNVTEMVQLNPPARPAPQVFAEME